MNEIIVCQGIPASGKSTWSKQFCIDNPEYVRINRDDLRHMRGTYWILEQENLISQWEVSMVNEALALNYSVIIDATNLTPGYINKWIDLAHDNNVDIEFKRFEISLEEAIHRDSLRVSPVGKEVIQIMYGWYLDLLASETRC